MVAEASPYFCSFPEKNPNAILRIRQLSEDILSNSLTFFLHERARDWTTLDDFVQNHKPESEQLDFKGKTPPNVAKLAERMASFANNRRGDIVIGIQEKDDKADRWDPIPAGEMPARMQQVSQAIQMIRPTELAVLIEPVRIRIPKSDEFAIVISIPPLAEIVCVPTNDKLSFPIRVETHTQFLPYEAVMVRTSSAARAAYLKLSQLGALGASIPIQFTSPVFGLVDGYQRAPVTSKTGSHAFSHSLTTEVLTALMKGVELTGERRNTRYGTVDERAYVMLKEHGELPITIPLELVRAAWLLPVAEYTSQIAIALDAEILWSSKSWFLRTR